MNLKNTKTSTIKYDSVKDRYWYKKTLYERTNLERVLFQKTLAVNVQEFTQAPNNINYLLKKAVLIFSIFKAGNKGHTHFDGLAGLGLSLGSKTLKFFQNNPKTGILLAGSVLAYKFFSISKGNKDSNLKH